MSSKIIDYISIVEEFHSTFGATINYHPQINRERIQKRIDWMREELNELEAALSDNDKIEVLDALVDIQYFLSGTVVECGMQKIFPEAFSEIHKSNMSKECLSMKEVVLTIDKYKECGVEAYFTFDSNRETWIVKRKSDNKVLKAINNYVGPELTKFLTENE